MHRAVLIILLWLIAIPGAVQAAAGDLRIYDLRHGVHEDRVRLILVLSEEPGFRVFRLSRPDRLVVDLPPFSWEVPPEQAEDLPFISAIRHGLFRPGKGRLILDLEQPVQIERIDVHPPRQGTDPRLIIDLAPVSRAAFDAGAGWPPDARWQADRHVDPAGPGVFTVAIDPGHGGVDPGARHGSMVEKQVVLDFAKRLAAAIEGQRGYRAFLTREDDSFVPLAERVALAHRAGADVLISIHADVLGEGRASGMSVYTLSEDSSDAVASALAERENRADVLAGADLGGESDALARLLIELAQRGTLPESERLAETLLSTLQPEFKLLRTRPHRRANFRVLKAPDIPSILLEIGFMDSPADRKRLGSVEWMDRAAARVMRGIERWRRDAPRPGEARAQPAD